MGHSTLSMVMPPNVIVGEKESYTPEKLGVAGEGITYAHVVCLPYKVMYKFATTSPENDGSWQWIKGYVDCEHVELPAGISTPQSGVRILFSCVQTVQCMIRLMKCWMR